MYSHRLQKFRHTLQKKSFQGSIISKRENISYLTGLHQVHPVNREALLFITLDEALLYHSIFLTPPPQINSTPMDSNHTLESTLASFFAHKDQIAFEAHNLTFAEHQRMQMALPHSTLIPVIDLLEQQRLLKDKSEKIAVKKACAITLKTMSWINQAMKRLSAQAINEISLSRLIENHLYDLGADSLAFPIIVAFDQNAALPHHLPDKTPLTDKSVVLLDFGCVVDGYCSDMTRTLCLDKSNTQFLKIEKVVKSAYSAALQLLQSQFIVSELTHSGSDQKRQRLGSPGVKASDLDNAARSVIDQAGYGKEFIHTTGHGLGLEIHEQPSLNSQNYLELKPGMVITLEPGINLPGHFGYRHENTILLK